MQNSIIKYPLYLALLLLLFSSCKEKPDCGKMKCTTVGLKLFLSGYNESDLDTMYLKTYNSADGTFTNLASEKILGIEDANIFTQRSDSARMIKDLIMEKGYSYVLILPATHDTMKMWGFYYSGDTIQQVCNSHGCYTFIKDCNASTTSTQWRTGTSQPASQDYGIVFTK